MSFLSSELFRIFAASLLIQMSSISPAISEEGLPAASYSVRLTDHKVLTVKLENNSYYYYSADDWLLLKKDILSADKGEAVIFLDVNDDQYDDVLVKLYDSGADSYYSLFLTHIKNNSIFLVEHDGVFGSPYINKERDLISISHNGPFSKIEKYKRNKGSLYRYQSISPINSDIEKLITYDSNGQEIAFSIRFIGLDVIACASVSSDQVFLSSAPSADTHTGTYFLHGGSLIILDATADGVWVKVQHVAEPAAVGWLLFDQIVINNWQSCGVLNESF
jgi:hypothetical protein